MKKRFNALCAVLGLVFLSMVTPALPQKVQKRIDGWGLARWGMSAQQVRAAYPRVQGGSGTMVHAWRFGLSQPQMAELVLRDVPVNGSWEAMFFFENGRLHNVVLRPQSVFTVQQARDVAADIRSQYGGWGSDTGGYVSAGAQPIMPNPSMISGRVRFEYNATKPQDTYIEYDCLQSFALPATAPTRPTNPNL